MVEHSRKRPILPFLFAIAISLGIGLYTGLALRSGTAAPAGVLRVSSATAPSTTFHRLDDVWALLQKEYVKQPLDLTTAVNGALEGMVQSLHDPYTTFFTPPEAKAFQDEVDGTFEGIGAEIGMKNNVLVVIAPLPDSPAEQSGLKAGDKILMINSQSTVDMTLERAVGIIRGKKGTTVKLTVQASDQTTHELTIMRDAITVQSVKLTMHGSIADIELSYFGQKTDQEFSSTVSQVLLNNAKGILLDVRNNPGGFLDSSVAVASNFVDKGTVVVTEKYRNGTQTQHPTKRAPRLKGLPVVVLVDQGSASAAEILAGALQDEKLATLVGTKTFGKGSVQQVHDFTDGASLKLTVAKWFTPKGRSIDEQGIQPDVVIENTKEDYDKNRDPQLDKALEILQKAIAR